MNKALLTSNSSEWETPQYFFDKLNNEFNFDVDVCANDKNKKCHFFYSDCLTREWSPLGVSLSCFMNPPYGRQICNFIKKAYEESQKGNLVVCLLPARTCTKWFHDYCLKGEVRFIKGRLKFSNAKENAPFPSMVVIFGDKNRKFCTSEGR